MGAGRPGKNRDGARAGICALHPAGRPERPGSPAGWRRYWPEGQRLTLPRGEASCISPQGRVWRDGDVPGPTRERLRQAYSGRLGIDPQRLSGEEMNALPAGDPALLRLTWGPAGDAGSPRTLELARTGAAAPLRLWLACPYDGGERRAYDLLHIVPVPPPVLPG